MCFNSTEEERLCGCNCHRLKPEPAASARTRREKALEEADLIVAQCLHTPTPDRYSPQRTGACSLCIAKALAARAALEPERGADR